MLQVESNVETIAVSAEKTYDFLLNFINQKVEGVPNIASWKSIDNGCEIEMSGIKLRLVVTDRNPYDKVVYRVETDKNINGDVEFRIQEVGEMLSQLKLQLRANVPFLMQPMLKGVIEKYSSQIMNYLKIAIERYGK